jgi:hypothetical protein
MFAYSLHIFENKEYFSEICGQPALVGRYVEGG